MKKILFAGSLLLIGMFIGCSKEKETAAKEKVKTQVLKLLLINQKIILNIKH